MVMSDEAQRITTAHEHAVFASELLNGISALSHRLENLTEHDHLQAAATGALLKANSDLRWTRDLAAAHAAVAIALGLTSPGEGPPWGQV
jgi:hypothetical protein